MKSTVRLTLNAFLFIFILLLPSLTPSAQPFFEDNDSDLYQWNQLQSPFKRIPNTISRSPHYNRKTLAELVRRMTSRRYVDDSYYKDIDKRQYPIHPGLVTFDALRGEQARLNQNRYRDRVKQNAKFFLQNGRR